MAEVRAVRAIPDAENRPRALQMWRRSGRRPSRSATRSPEEVEEVSWT
jgi:hypothetical protein